jgi:hypothetical protein
MVLLRDIMRDEIGGRCRRAGDVSWYKYFGFAGSNSLTGYICIKQARDGWYKYITLRTYIEVNDLLKFRTL